MFLYVSAIGIWWLFIICLWFPLTLGNPYLTKHIILLEFLTFPARNFIVVFRYDKVCSTCTDNGKSDLFCWYTSKKSKSYFIFPLDTRTLQMPKRRYWVDFFTCHNSFTATIKYNNFLSYNECTWRELGQPSNNDYFIIIQNMVNQWQFFFFLACQECRVSWWSILFRIRLMHPHTRR